MASTESLPKIEISEDIPQLPKVEVDRDPLDDLLIGYEDPNPGQHDPLDDLLVSHDKE